ncbi:tetratricopeptide repeat protein [Streptomyces sp. S.PB5]|uniref:tetratricopeptide repeat protein n=1 Tax=Streptomyces sp. S.PB5 TaxID=3020844 RepID=UPI0025AFC2B8|nr:tetratricopeptide repeat protein [Streptomyces sp. S.PB5]MDN3021061.1 tetratricopeptide repeat protein [Streptomyces sp. S.PB5]
MRAWVITVSAGVGAGVAAGAPLAVKAAESTGTFLWWLALGAATVAALTAAIATHVARKPPQPEATTGPLSGPPHNLPVLSMYFTGRTAERERIVRALRGPTRRRRRGERPAPRVCVLYGATGAGKSQLAVDYAYRQLPRHSLTWWLDASRPDALRAQLLEFAKYVGIPEQKSKNVVLMNLWSRLREQRGWLLVYDGCPAYDDSLRGLLPSEGDGEVLITTQQHHGWTGLSATPIELRAFPEQEGIEFLGRRLDIAPERLTDGIRRAMTALGRQLGWLPLALEQAAAYIVQAEITVAEYLRDLPSGASVEEVFRRSITRVSEASPAAVDLLRLLAFLASEDVQKTTLTLHRSVLPARLRTVMTNPITFNREVLLLVDHSLLTRNGDWRDGSAVYGMHPRVRILIHEELRVEQRLEWSQAAVRLMEACFPTTPDLLASRPLCERLMPHVEAVIDERAWGDDIGGGLGASQDFAALARLLHRVGTYQETRCDWVRALDFFEQEAALREIGDNDELARATARTAVARQYYELATLDAAEEECRRALELCADRGEEAFLRLRAQCQRQLGGIMRERNDFPEALRAVRTAVGIYEAQVWREDSLDWAVAEQEIGLIHRNAGQLTQAVLHYERAEKRIPSRGSQEPPEYTLFRAMLQRDLGIVAQDRGDLERAERELSLALSVFRTHRGPEDFETAQICKFLADVLRRRSELHRARARRTLRLLHRVDLWRKARAELMRADRILVPVVELHSKRSAAEEHKYAACLNKLGSLRLAQGRTAEARQVLEQADGIYQRRYGPEHYYRAKSLTRLGPVLRAEGDGPGAEEVLRKAERIFHEALGESHPALIAVHEHLADCAADRGDHEEAVRRRALADGIRRSL